MFLSDFIRNEFHVDVGVESLRKILSDGVQTRTVSWLVILLANVLVDNQELIFSDLFFVHLKHGSLSMFGILKADITVILKIALLIALYLSRFNITVLSE